jgi:hypothetical protein
MFEGAQKVIRRHKSKKDRKYNEQMKKTKRETTFHKMLHRKERISNTTQTPLNRFLVGFM